ncbi:MAG: phosphoribosylanthranilate isomerase [Planctomycetota bacterium]
MARTRVKICGVRDPDTAWAAAEAGADAIGLVFADGSPRRVAPDAGASIMFGLPPMVSTVGVIVDQGVDAFCELEQRCPCELWQLHGDEPESTVKACGPGVIKAIGFTPDTIVRDIERWSAVAEVSALLIDNPKAGSGEPIDWPTLRAALDQVEGLPPVFLAGGLTPETVGEAVRVVQPWGVDVSSGVELERGVKDPGKIQAFCEAVHAADASLS